VARPPKHPVDVKLKIVLSVLRGESTQAEVAPARHLGDVDRQRNGADWNVRVLLVAGHFSDLVPAGSTGPRPAAVDMQPRRHGTAAT
jgi:hypothetical protein